MSLLCFAISLTHVNWSSDFSDFWQKCYCGSNQSKDTLFYHVT